MKLTTIYFFRHGEVDNPNGIIYGSSVDVPLNQKGHLQMQKFGKYLKDKRVNPSAIYISDLIRSKESANEIAKSFKNIQIVQDIRLKDLIQPGLEKYTFEWIKSVGGDLYNYHGEERKNFELEAPEHQVERIIAVLLDILKKHGGETVFVVSHGDPLLFAMWRLLHPAGEIPPYKTLVKDYYLEKGTAWKVVFDESNQVIEYELVSCNK